MIVAGLPAPPATAADVLKMIDRLGGIDPARVRMQPLPGTATEDDLIRANDRKDKTALCELVDGALVEKVMGFEEDLLAQKLARLLGNVAESRRLGVIVGSQAPMRMTLGNVRMPDAAFISAEKWRSWRRHKPAVADFGPDLAVEVLSRSNTRAEMNRKRREYFAAGTRLIWEINPRRRTVTVYTGPRTSTRLTVADTLDGGDVLPGFALPVADLFADPLDDAAP
jgi:Uma2 family endonuclease